MALIPCSGCGHHISDHAQACPKCKRPASALLETGEVSSPSAPATSENNTEIQIAQRHVFLDACGPATAGRLLAIALWLFLSVMFTVLVPALIVGLGTAILVALAVTVVLLQDGDARGGLTRWGLIHACNDFPTAFKDGQRMGALVGGVFIIASPIGFMFRTDDTIAPVDTTASLAPAPEDWKPVRRSDARSVVVEIPVLAVTEGEHRAVGSVETLKLHFERVPDSSEPFTIAISEDTPGGAGPMLRSSAWLAATVAALQRNDDLSGVRIRLQVPDRLDGSSAGATLTLALLTVLDGRTLPRDFVCTGSILPDGTVGRVGGVAAKIQAAAASKIKRVLVPAYLRFQEDPTTDELVDIKRLADSQGLEFVPVENIERAYQAVHRLSIPAKGLQHTSPALPFALEKHFAQNTQQLLSATDATALALPETAQRQLTSHAAGTQLLGYRTAADQALRSGQLYYAFSCAVRYHHEVQALGSLARYLEALDPQQFQAPDDYLARMAADAKSEFQLVPDAWTLAENCVGDPLSSQFYTDIGSVRFNQVFSEQLERQLALQVDAPTADPADGARQKLTDQERFALGLQCRGTQLALAKAARQFFSDFPSSTEVLREKLGAGPPLRPYAYQVERFFYTAAAAVDHTLQSSLIGPAAASEQLSPETVQRHLSELDTNYWQYTVLAPVTDEFHRKVGELRANNQPQPFLEALSAQLAVLQLAHAGACITTWNELDVQDDGTYGRLAFLSYLLRTARQNALDNIGDCQAVRIPCPQAVYHFQRADAERDNAATDRVEVLVGYWKASLEAQALRMLFSPTHENGH